MVTIAGYAVEHFGASTSTAGLVSSIFIIGTLFGRLGTGRIIGDWGSKNIILWIIIVYAINDVLFYRDEFAPSYAQSFSTRDCTWGG